MRTVPLTAGLLAGPPNGPVRILREASAAPAWKHQMGNKKTSPRKAPPSSPARGHAAGSNGASNGAPTAAPVSPAQVLLDQARHLLELDKPQEAFDLINAKGSGAPAMKNARGVCLMRMQQPALAVRTYRSIVLDHNGISLRSDVPIVYKTNFATALLLDGNVSGCQSVLDEIRDENDPGVQKLRSVIQRWVSELSFLKRLAWKAGSQPAHPVTIDFVPGELA
jgi:hypothetical protein